MDHDERGRRRAVRGGARVAARRLAAGRTRRRATLRVQRLAGQRRFQPAAAAAHPGQAVRPRAGRHSARAATLGLPSRRAGLLRAPVSRSAHLLQLARGARAQVDAAVLASWQRRVQAVRGRGLPSGLLTAVLELPVRGPTRGPATVVRRRR